jgi:hypothetical protein
LVEIKSIFANIFKHKMKLKYICLLGCLMQLGITTLKAQITTDTLGSVMLTKDTRFDKAKLIISEPTSKTEKPKVLKDKNGNYQPILVRGYRLQVLTTTDKALANQMKARLYTMFPNEKAYVLAKPPYFSVLQGDYFKEADALKAKQYAQKALGQVVYVVSAQLLALPPEAAKQLPPNPTIKKP